MKNKVLTSLEHLAKTLDKKCYTVNGLIVMELGYYNEDFSSKLDDSLRKISITSDLVNYYRGYEGTYMFKVAYGKNYPELYEVATEIRKIDTGLKLERLKWI